MNVLSSKKLDMLFSVSHYYWSAAKEWLALGVEMLPPHRRLQVKPDTSLLVLFFLCLLAYPPVCLLFLSSPTLPREDLIPVLQIHSTANTYCSQSQGSLPIHSEFGISYQACKQLCLHTPDCHFFTHGPWLKMGYRYRQSRCQLYKNCVPKAQNKTVLHEVKGRAAAVGLLLLYTFHFASSMVWFFFFPLRAGRFATLLIIPLVCIVVLLVSSHMQQSRSVIAGEFGVHDLPFPWNLPLALTLAHHTVLPCLLMVIHAQLKHKLKRAVKREKFSEARLCELRRLLAEKAKQQRDCSADGSKAAFSLAVASIMLGLLATASHFLASSVSGRGGADGILNLLLKWLWGVDPFKGALFVAVLLLLVYLLSPVFIATLRRMEAALFQLFRLRWRDDELYMSTNALSSAIYQQELTLLRKLKLYFAAASSERAIDQESSGRTNSNPTQLTTPGYMMFQDSQPLHHAVQIYKQKGVKGTIMCRLTKQISLFFFLNFKCSFLCLRIYKYIDFLSLSLSLTLSHSLFLSFSSSFPGRLQFKIIFFFIIIIIIIIPLSFPVTLFSRNSASTFPFFALSSLSSNFLFQTFLHFLTNSTLYLFVDFFFLSTLYCTSYASTHSLLQHQVLNVCQYLHITGELTPTGIYEYVNERAVRLVQLDPYYMSEIVTPYVVEARDSAEFWKELERACEVSKSRSTTMLNNVVTQALNFCTFGLYPRVSPTSYAPPLPLSPRSEVMSPELQRQDSL